MAVPRWVDDFAESGVTLRDTWQMFSKEQQETAIELLAAVNLVNVCGTCGTVSFAGWAVPPNVCPCCLSPTGGDGSA